MQTLEQLRAGDLNGVRRLTLCCGLTEFPREIFHLAETLEILDLSGNALSELPDDLARLTKLRIVFCSDNRFTELPEVLGTCPELSMVGFKANRIRKVPAGSLPVKLRWLVLTDNEIEALPVEIGACVHLQKLMLAGNRLRALPETLGGCHRLELLRLAANRLDEWPEWLLALPRLSWLAYSGNPFGNDAATAARPSAPIADVAWGSLTIDRLLGQGASGVIHRAVMNSADAMPRAVAVKLFKGAVTSDGLPASEMAASIGAGKHPHLIDVFGRVTHHPSGIDGLVMQLVDPRLQILAGPPSLESCTRDIYPPSAAFDLTTVLRIAGGIASAAAHLHARGIMHGDLYAHNILHDRRGGTLLGDFGAASFYDAGNAALAKRLQRLEVRAFGCLLEELIDRCDVAGHDSAVMRGLTDLASACLCIDPERRPRFDDIGAMLADATAVAAEALADARPPPKVSAIS